MSGDMMDVRLQEAVHYVKAWSEGMAARWLKIVNEVSRRGFKVSPTLEVEVEGLGFAVVSLDQSPGVSVQFGGETSLLSECLTDFGFDLDLLPKVREAVERALDEFEARLEKKLLSLPALQEEFGIGAIDYALEKRLGGARP
ncbi:MAG: hypothetical protein ACRD1Z_04395 [Vicinamibacteria bacterium]